MKFRIFLANAVAISALLAVPAAEAKLGGSKFSAPSHSASQIQSSGGQRLGGGQSMGMQRDSVMSNVRNPAASTTNPSTYVPAPSSSVSPQTAAPQQGYRPGWGTVAGAAALAGAAGYAMGNHEGAPGTLMQNAPAGGYNGGDQMMQNGAVNGFGAMQPHSSGGSWFWVLLLLGACGAGFYYLSRRQATVFSGTKGGFGNASISSGLPPISSGGFKSNDSIYSIAEQLFRDLQAVNNSGDAAQLRSLCTPALAAELESSLGGNTQIMSVRATVVDDSDAVASVHYQSVIMEDGRHPEEIDEVWHFVRNQQSSGSPWLLAGIEQK